MTAAQRAKLRHQIDQAKRRQIARAHACDLTAKDLRVWREADRAEAREAA